MYEWKQYYRQGLQSMARAKRLEQECALLAQRLGRNITPDERDAVYRALEKRELAFDFWAPWRASASVICLLLVFLAWRFIEADALIPTLLCVGGAGYSLFLALKAHLEVQRGKQLDPAAVEQLRQEREAS